MLVKLNDVFPYTVMPLANEESAFPLMMYKTSEIWPRISLHPLSFSSSASLLHRKLSGWKTHCSKTDLSPKTPGGDQLTHTHTHTHTHGVQINRNCKLSFSYLNDFLMISGFTEALSGIRGTNEWHAHTRKHSHTQTHTHSHTLCFPAVSRYSFPFSNNLHLFPYLSITHTHTHT